MVYILIELAFFSFCLYKAVQIAERKKNEPKKLDRY
jgi:hypothetical protein